MSFLSDHSNITFSPFAIQNSYLKIVFLTVNLLLLYICFLHSLMQWSEGIKTATVQNTRELCFCVVSFQAFKFWFGLWLFLSLETVFFLILTAYFYFLYPLTPEFSFFSLLFLQLNNMNHITRKGNLMKTLGPMIWPFFSVFFSIIKNEAKPNLKSIHPLLLLLLVFWNMSRVLYQ